MKKSCTLFFLILILLSKIVGQQDYVQTDVLVFGGSASGTTAAIQAARLGAKTIIIEETAWLGGMLTAAGVSATDGNHELASGLWREFRDSLYKYYGGKRRVETGWVSNTQFEPSVGAEIFKKMAEREIRNLRIFYQSSLQSVKRLPKKTEYYDKGWMVVIKDSAGLKWNIHAKILIDATELGDIAKMVGIRYRIGTDDPKETGETGFAVAKTNIVQDMTYAAIIKDYGPDAPRMPRPKGYDPKQFYCACLDNCLDIKGVVGCAKMLDYGKLPNRKYMINWPKYGNDYYANIIEADNKTRQKAYDEAKLQTKRFIYYIQNELGFSSLALADDEFPTKDSFPMIPYHRESRRIFGQVTMTLNHVLKPYDYALYRTGIAVGDYPIDHHHDKYPNQAQVPKFEFPPIPAFNVPLGALIPLNVEDFIVAEKSISVSNIVNGSTRLQPCVMLIGQAAGVLASLSVRGHLTPKHVPVRMVQNVLLNNGAYIMPFSDVKPDHPHFYAIQRIGAVGIMKGRLEPQAWANRMWFAPDSTLTWGDFTALFEAATNPAAPDGGSLPRLATTPNDILTITDAAEILAAYGSMIMKEKDPLLTEVPLMAQYIKTKWTQFGFKDYVADRPIRRAEMAVLFDTIFEPFKKKVDLNGEFKN